MKKQSGQVGILLETGICILGMVSMLGGFLFLMGMLQTKETINQLARRYVLQMECEGYLTREMEQSLMEELALLGLEKVTLEGTDRFPVAYGEKISLCIRAVWGSVYEIYEKRVTTAKSG